MQVQNRKERHRRFFGFISFIILVMMITVNAFANGPWLYAGSEHQWPTGYIKAVKLLYTPDDIPGLNEIFQNLGITREAKEYVIDVSAQAVEQHFLARDGDTLWYFRVHGLEDDTLPPGPYSVVAAWSEIAPENEHGWTAIWSEWSPPLLFTKPGTLPAPSTSIGKSVPGT